MSKQNRENEPIKVTDKRLFTSDGEIRDEFKASVHPADPDARPVPPPPPAPPAAAETVAATPEKKRELQPRAENPGTKFTNLVESLVYNAYMSLGMMRSPYGQAPVDLVAARQMIDFVEMLTEKTVGNLTLEEEEYLKTHTGEVKLAYVQRSKAI